MKTVSPKSYHIRSVKTVMLGSEPQLLQTLVTVEMPLVNYGS
jgi:hypothetical protein